MEQHCQHAVCKLQSVLSSFSFQSSFTLLSLVIHQRECRHVTLVLTPPVSKLVLQVQTAFCPCNFLQKKRASAVTVKTRRSLTGQACYFETSSGCRSLATISSGLFLFIFFSVCLAHSGALQSPRLDGVAIRYRWQDSSYCVLPVDLLCTELYDVIISWFVFQVHFLFFFLMTPPLCFL